MQASVQPSRDILGYFFHGLVLWFAVGYQQHLTLACLWHGSFLGLLEQIIPGTTPQEHREPRLGTPSLLSEIQQVNPFWLSSDSQRS